MIVVPVLVRVPRRVRLLRLVMFKKHYYFQQIQAASFNQLAFRIFVGRLPLHSCSE